MGGAEDRGVWERRPFPLERLVRDARPSASQFRILMRKTSRASGPSGRSTPLSRRALQGAARTLNYTEIILYSIGYSRFLQNSSKQ
jgi:hypothetical protein